MLRDFDETRPLNEAQSGLWFIRESDPESPMLNNGEYYELRGAIDSGALESAVNTMVEECEILRMRFLVTESGPRQRLEPDLTYPMRTVDLTDVEDPRAAALEIMRKDLATPLDVTRDPLYTHTLFRLGPDHHLWYQRAHHLMVDGYTFMLLARRVAEVYSGMLAGTGAGEPLGSFRELLAEARDYENGPEKEEDTRFWADYLKGAPHHTSLMPRREEPRRHYLRSTRLVGEEDVAEIERAAKKAGTGWKQLLMAAVAAYTQRWTGESDILISLPVAARTTGLSRRTPGMSSNVIPLRLNVDPVGTVASVARDVADSLRACLPHQRHPVALTRRLLGQTPQTRREFGPLINIMSFDYDVDFGGLPCVPHNIFQGPIEELRIDILQRRRGGALHIDFDANPSVFSQEELERYTDSFIRVLEAIRRDPNVVLGDLDPVSEDESRKVVEGFGRGEETTEGHRVLHEVFEERVVRAPEAVALVFEGEEVSYGGLNARANRLARYLCAEGVGSGEIVGVHLSRSPEMVVALLAVLKAGAGYTVLDPAFPKARLEAVVDGAGIRTLIGDSASSSVLEAPETRKVAVDIEAERIGALDPENLGLDVSPEDVACVMFTSGSSGVPKGVVTAHRGLVGTFLGQDYLDFGADQVWLQCSPVSWDAFALELFGALLFGGRCVLQPGQRPRFDAIADLVVEHGVTDLQMSAGLFNVMLDERPEVFDVVRTAMTAGEAASVAHVARALVEHPGVRIVNGYGPAENMGFTTTHEVGSVEAGQWSIPIGGPLAGARVLLLDGRLRPVPVGVPGELYIGGATLALGYLNRADLTAERFVPNPFGGPGERMYRTGDLARWTSSGDLEYVGRVDDQVKVRGFRVEPGEVEVVLTSLPGVARAAVVVCEDRPGDRRLVAYVVGASGTEPDGVGIRAALTELLPEYMVPSAVVVLDGLPLTANGKLDRRALPAPDYASMSSGRSPRTPTEEILCRLFAEVLGLERVGIDDSFFDLGGHSLLATRLISRIRSALGHAPSIRDLFRSPTVAGVAASVLSASTTPAQRRITRRERPERIPMSSAQSRLWFLHQWEGPSPTYNIPIVVRLQGEIDEEALRRALADVVGRHEALRTVFPTAEGESFQRILGPEEAEPELEVVVPSAPDAHDEIHEALSHTFDLENRIPIRGWLMRTGDSEAVLVVLLHHIAGDGWSMVPLMDDLAAAYADRLQGRGPGWSGRPDLAVQYADYALWQHDVLGDPTDPESLAGTRLAFWKKALEGAPELLELPTDRPRPTVASHRGGTVPFSLPEETHRGLIGLAAAQGVTLFMVVQAALAVALGRSGAGTDLPIGTSVAGRSDEALDHLVGFFVNSLVLRTDLSGDPTFTELLARVRETDLAAFDHGDVPFDKVVEALAPSRSTARHPLFQVMLVLQNNTAARLDLSGVEAEVDFRHMGRTKFDLTLDIGEEHDGTGAPSGIVGRLEYAVDLFERETAEALVARVERVLMEIVTGPERRIGDIDLLSADEARRVLPEIDDGHRAVIAGRTVHEVFEERVVRAPEAVALVFEGEEVSYGGLNARANRLARYLCAEGVGSGEIVGVHLSRSPEMVVALLAVLKAGAGYTVLDPAFPKARLERVMREAKVRTLVTDADLSPVLEFPDTRQVLVDTDAAAIARQEATDPGITVTTEDVACVMFTSGSSGVPKGVVTAHRGLVGTFLGQDYLDFGADQVWLQCSPVSWDAFALELFGALLFGGRCVLQPGQRPRFDAIADLVVEHGVTDLQMSAGLFNVMLDERPEVFDVVRTAMTAGEAASVAHVARALVEHPGVRIVNGYGPAENMGFTTTYEIDALMEDRPSVPIGRPVKGSGTYVLDRRLRPVPVGVPGELYIGGATLALGYLNRADLTAERFVPNPFGGPGERMYRTGDLARWTSSGDLEYVGRVDDQVKVRGFRVEPGEVEVVLTSLPGVAQAAVVPREDRSGTLVLVAYVVGASGTEPDGVGIRAALTELLPEYMVPSAVVVLDGLPLTANGKLDRRALPVPEHGPSSSGRGPRGPREEILCRLFAEVLGLERVGIDDSFFDLGGHSLLATRLVARVRSALDQEVSLEDVFRAPEPARLAERLDRVPVSRPRPTLRRRTRAGMEIGG